MTNCNISYPIIYQIFSYYCEKDKLCSIKTISKEFSNSFNKLNIKKCNVIKFRNLIVCKDHGDSVLFDGVNTLASLDSDQWNETIHFKTKESLDSVKHYLYLFGFVKHYCCDGAGVVYDGCDGKYNRISSLFEDQTMLSNDEEFCLHDPRTDTRLISFFNRSLVELDIRSFCDKSQRRSFPNTKRKAIMSKKRYRNHQRYHQRYSHNIQKRQVYG
jgi:hypothetical protein